VTASGTTWYETSAEMHELQEECFARTVGCHCGVLASTRTQNVSEYMLVLALCLVHDSRDAKAVIFFLQSLSGWEFELYPNSHPDKDCRKKSLPSHPHYHSCATVPRRRFFGDFLRPVFPASRVQHISNLHSKFALRPRHVWKYMIDI